MANGTVNANGNYPSDDGELVESPRLLVLASSAGALGGATAKLQAYHADTGIWVDLPSGSFTADTIKNVNINAEMYIRLNVASYASDFEYFF